MEPERKIPEVVVTREEAETLLRAVIQSFTQEQKDILAYNIKAGKFLNCGPRAYVFCGHDSGDLITLSLTTDLPRHVLDFERINPIERLSVARYGEIIKEHTLRYYFATQVLDEPSFRNLILDCLGESA